MVKSVRHQHHHPLLPKSLRTECKLAAPFQGQRAGPLMITKADDWTRVARMANSFQGQVEVGEVLEAAAPTNSSVHQTTAGTEGQWRAPEM